MNEYAWSIFTYKLQDKYKYGIELAEKAVKLKPKDADIWDTLAWLYFADGNNQKAISAMKKAVKIKNLNAFGALAHARMEGLIF